LAWWRQARGRRDGESVYDFLARTGTEKDDKKIAKIEQLQNQLNHDLTFKVTRPEGDGC
jgi:hypothetical protein